VPPPLILDELDWERPDEPFVVGLTGRQVAFAAAAGPAWSDLLEAMSWPPAFLDLFGPADPDDRAAVERLPVWQMRELLRRWRIHHGLCPVLQDNVRLAALLGKASYRAAAERDLWEVDRLDLTQEWRSRRWRRLLNLLDGKRRTSWVHDAMMQDEELAAIYLEQERRGQVTAPGKSGRKMTEYTVEAELLSYAVDRLGELIVATAASRGAKTRRVKPMPRPETAVHRVRERRARNTHAYTVARVFGYIDEKGRPTGRGPRPAGTPATP
jgi:hypothetical protein